jgi:hypothetical protein
MAATEWDDDDHDDKTQPSGSSGTDGTIAPGVTDAATAAAAASARSAQSSWGARDLEGLTSSGEWQQSIYHRNGLRAATGDSFAARFPVTTRIVEKLLGLPSSSSSSGSGGYLPNLASHAFRGIVKQLRSFVLRCIVELTKTSTCTAKSIDSLAWLAGLGLGCLRALLSFRCSAKARTFDRIADRAM